MRDRQKKSRDSASRKFRNCGHPQPGSCGEEGAAAGACAQLLGRNPSYVPFPSDQPAYHFESDLG